jgi:hypothetical protein
MNVPPNMQHREISEISVGLSIKGTILNWLSERELAM